MTRTNRMLQRRTHTLHSRTPTLSQIMFFFYGFCCFLPDFYYDVSLNPVISTSHTKWTDAKKCSSSLHPRLVDAESWHAMRCLYLSFFLLYFFRVSLCLQDNPVITMSHSVVQFTLKGVTNLIQVTECSHFMMPLHWNKSMGDTSYAHSQMSCIL